MLTGGEEATWNNKNKLYYKFRNTCTHNLSNVLNFLNDFKTLRPWFDWTNFKQE